MVRYLVVLECFLLVLLISPWIGGAFSHGNLSVEQSAEQSAGGSAEQSPARPSTEVGAKAALSAARDRAMLAGELLGLRNGGFQNTQPNSSPPHAARPASGGSAIASGSAAPAAANAAMPAADQQTGGQARRSSGEGDSAPSPADVMAAQRFLMRLGYLPGAADGVLGERTQRALNEYRRRTGAAADGRVLSDALLTKLRRDASRAAARESQLRRIAAQSPRRHESASGWVGSIAGGFQRLLGHEFDSRKQPGRLRDYCRDNRETWIFDEGRGDFAYCGHLLAAQ